RGATLYRAPIAGCAELCALAKAQAGCGRPAVDLWRRQRCRGRSATATPGRNWSGYRPMCQIWRRNWERITPFFQYPAEIRKVIYTTNAVEALHRSLRKIIKTRGAFPHEQAALKLLFLALRQAAKKWNRPLNHWREALNHFAVLWPERMPSTERLAG